MKYRKLTGTLEPFGSCKNYQPGISFCRGYHFATGDIILQLLQFFYKVFGGHMLQLENLENQLIGLFAFKTVYVGLVVGSL